MTQKNRKDRLTVALVLIAARWRWAYLVIAGLIAAGTLHSHGPVLARGSPAAHSSVTTIVPSLVLDLGDDTGADVTALLAANDVVYVIEKTAGEVRAFPLHGMDRAEQFTKVLRRREGDNGLIIGQPVALAMAGEMLYVLDDRASLWQYDPAASVRTLVGLRVESRQGTLRGIVFPKGQAELDVLDESASGQDRLWAYRQGPRGYTSSPRLLPWGTGLPAGQIALVGSVGQGELLVAAGGTPVLVSPSSHRPVLKVSLPGSQQPDAVGTVWKNSGAPATILLLDGAHREVAAVHAQGGPPLPALHFTLPALARGGWRAVSGDASSGRVYLLDGANHVFSMPMPASWFRR